MTTCIKVQLTIAGKTVGMEFGKTVETKPNTAFKLENQSNSKPAQLQFSISKR